jgi:hypothetical protein
MLRCGMECFCAQSQNHIAYRADDQRATRPVQAPDAYTHQEERDADQNNQVE